MILPPYSQPFERSSMLVQKRKKRTLTGAIFHPQHRSYLEPFIAIVGLPPQQIPKFEQLLYQIHLSTDYDGLLEPQMPSVGILQLLPFFGFKPCCL